MKNENQQVAGQGSADETERILQARFGTKSLSDIWAHEFGLSEIAEPISETERALMRMMIISTEWARFELKRSPETYFNYSKGKEIRYCAPWRWSEVEESALAGWRAATDEALSWDEMERAKTSEGFKKALVVTAAKCGHKIEKMFPGFLEQCVEKGQWQTLDKVHRAKNDKLTPTMEKSWKLFVSLYWACSPPWGDKIPRHMAWPFCFWSDEAIVSYVAFFGADTTLDKWRKFRRYSGLKRPDYTVIAGVEEVFDGCELDGIERESIGLKVRLRVRKVPASDC